MLILILDFMVTAVAGRSWMNLVEARRLN